MKNMTPTKDEIHWLVNIIPQYLVNVRVLSYIEKEAFLNYNNPEGKKWVVPVENIIKSIFKVLEVKDPKRTKKPSASSLPFISYENNKFILYYGYENNVWKAISKEGKLEFHEISTEQYVYKLKTPEHNMMNETATQLFNRIFKNNLSWLAQASVASLVGSILLLGTSLYTMQVYDRVIGSGGISTLFVLTGGVLLAIIFEYLMKIVKAQIVDNAAYKLDYEYSTIIFQKLLHIRLDQFPSSIGNIAQQIKGFENIRIFQFSFYLYIFTEIPYVCFFIIFMYIIGGGLLIIPAICVATIALLIGSIAKYRIANHAKIENLVGNKRYGLLIDTIRAIETLKSFGGTWNILNSWNNLSEATLDETTKIKKIGESVSFMSGSLQQIGYISLVAIGAWIATQTNEITIGAIIACSILSGRVLGPLNKLPSLIVQGAHAKVSLRNLDKIFELKTDNDTIRYPLSPDSISGQITMRNLEYSYNEHLPPITIGECKIEKGEKIAILGSIGTGKSTILRLLAGQFKASKGAVLYDGVDIQQIAAQRRSELIGYLPQIPSLVEGTLRSNLLFGLNDLSDAEIMKAVDSTGLNTLIASRENGLETPIMEGGEGLSGGQRNLISFTRLLLSDYKVLLLDEPTSSFDHQTEMKCLESLRKKTDGNSTLIIVTHKLNLLDMVDRVIVINTTGIAFDGPKEDFINKMKKGST